jgi:hypothetical protein
MYGPEDEIKFTEYAKSSMPPWGHSDLEALAKNNPGLITESKGTPWKYNEEEIVKELLEYIRGTYKQHYAANDENIQTLDFIEAAHKDGEAFCRDNILKYTSRYDKKGTADRDIMKIQHYSVLLKFFRNKNKKHEIYNQ